jgi:hypothetical protein
LEKGAEERWQEAGYAGFFDEGGREQLLAK